jgi:hypothetical protein
MSIRNIEKFDSRTGQLPDWPSSAGIGIDYDGKLKYNKGGVLTSLAEPESKFVLNAGAGPLVASAGDLTGANRVYAQYSGVNGSTLTTRTAAQMIADGGYGVGATWVVRVINTAAGNLTLTAGSGVTVTGKTVIATNTYVDYVVTVTGAATITFQSVGSGTVP